MKQAGGELTIETHVQGLIDITDRIADWLGRQAIHAGLLTVFCRHTSASLLINENAARAVRHDIEAYFARIAPEGGDYAHDDEGSDDMLAHLRTALTSVSLSIPVVAGRMALGTWQGVFLFEHRRTPHRRRIALHAIGD